MSHSIPNPSALKTCNKCKEVKPLTEFYQRKSGKAAGEYYPQCKECHRATDREYHRANRDKRLVKITEYRQANKEKLATRERERRADPAYREKVSAELKQWREENRDHVAEYNRGPEVKARQIVNSAVKSGKLPSPSSMICEDCQEALAAHYHHLNGYEPEHWFDIAALCIECHGKEHRAQ